MGQSCGAILWESKRTKNWSDGWLAKLRADQRAANAEIAVLVSRALPKDIDAFGHIDGVWVTEPRFAIRLAIALRQTLTEVANTRQFQDVKRRRWSSSTNTSRAQNFGIAWKQLSKKSPTWRET
jgi:hypothetical protein